MNDFMIELGMSVVGVGMAFSIIPQIKRLIQRKTSDDLSLLTWYFILIGQICWFLYGLYKHSISLLITEAVWIIASTALIFLIHKYRR